MIYNSRIAHFKHLERLVADRLTQIEVKKIIMCLPFLTGVFKMPIL